MYSESPIVISDTESEHSQHELDAGDFVVLESPIKIVKGPRYW